MRKKIFFLTGLFLILMVGPLPVFSRDFASHQLLTPVYPWRTPASQGKIKILILAHSWTTPEMAEFAKRFDFDYDLVPIWSEEFLDRSWKSEGTRKLHRRIISLLTEKTYQCILITSYGNFPATVWEAIYRQCVGKKTGLLLFNTGGYFGSFMPKQMEKDGFWKNEYCLKDIPFSGVSWSGFYQEMLEMDSRGNFAGFQQQSYQLSGKVSFAQRPEGSRIILFNWQKEPYAYWSIHHGISPAGLFFPFGRIFPMADHLFALVGKAVVWASHCEGKLKIVSVSPSDSEVSPLEKDSLRYAVTVRNESSQKKTATIVWEALDENEVVQDSGKYQLTVAATGEKTVKLNHLPDTGQHLYFRCRLLQGDKVTDWGSSHLKVVYPENILSFSVSNGTLNPANQPFRCQLAFNGIMPGDKIRIHVYDGWGRLVRAVEKEISGPRMEVLVDTRDLSGYAFRLKAMVLRNGKAQANKDQFCTLLEPLGRHYYNIRADSATSTVTGWYLSRLNRLYGLNFYRTKGSPLSANMMFGFRFGVYSYYGRIVGPVPPEMEKTYEKFVEEDVIPVKPYGGYLYDFGDDTGVGQGLFKSRAATDQQRQAEEQKDWQNFISYLKTVYRDAAELSENWQIPVQNFTEITREQVTEQQKKKNLVPLLDYRQYQEWLYASHLRKMKSLLQEKIPWAKVTLNGYGDIGKNFDLVCREVDSLVPYYRPSHLRVLRGILGRDKYLGTCTGAYYSDSTDKRFLSFIPWETVLLGGNTVFLWGAGCISGDGGLSESTYPIFESCRELAQGIGELLACSEWQNDGFYILYSPASNHAQESFPHLGRTKNSSESFATFLEELQIGYDYISSFKLAAGELLRTKARVLFLPYSVGLEVQAQKAIREFVSSGGVVIADFRPATRTVHGKLLPAGGLDDLFGVRQKKVEEYCCRGNLGETGVETLADLSTEPAGARPAGWVGKAPVLLTHKYGQGQTLLLNCFIGKYRSLYADNRAGALTEWLVSALKLAGINGRPYGYLPSGTRVFRYNHKGLELMAVYREDLPGTPERKVLTLLLPGEKAVYSLRSGKFLGELTKLEISVGKLEPVILALSERKMPRFQVKSFRQVCPGETLRMTVSSSGNLSRLLRLDVFQPDGLLHSGSGRLFWLEGEKTEVTWLPALSDLTGLYRLEITDIITGQKEVFPVTVKGNLFVYRR